MLPGVDVKPYRANVSFNGVAVGEHFDADPAEMAALVERGYVTAVESTSEPAPAHEASAYEQGDETTAPTADQLADRGVDKPKPRRARKASS